MDPQFYFPHSNKPRLVEQKYWPKISYDPTTFFQGAEVSKLIRRIVRLNRKLKTNEIILPGLFASPLNDAWVEAERCIVECGRRFSRGLPVITTVALDEETTRNPERIEYLLESAEDWDTDGFYLVFEHPDDEYLVSNKHWVTNILDLVAGLRLLGHKVIIGYCNHQMLLAASVKATAICSGSWKNVRQFTKGKFEQEPTGGRSVSWYYCPQALSEYKLSELDLAFHTNSALFFAMETAKRLGGQYASDLFSGQQPSDSDFKRRKSSLHYLDTLRNQVITMGRPTYIGTRRQQEALFARARVFARNVNRAGLSADDRDFSVIARTNLEASDAIHRIRGAILKRCW